MSENAQEWIFVAVAVLGTPVALIALWDRPWQKWTRNNTKEGPK